MSRKTVRQQIATQLADVSEADFVYAYLPQDLEGKTNVVCVYNDTAESDTMSRNIANDFYNYNIDLLTLRKADGSHEDDLDDLYAGVIAELKTILSNAAYWSLLTINGSEAFHATVSGKAYRVEQIKIKVKVTT